MAIFLSADIEVVGIVRPFGVTIVFHCPPHTSSDIHSENEEVLFYFQYLIFMCSNWNNIIMVNKMKSGLMTELKNMELAVWMETLSVAIWSLKPPSIIMLKTLYSLKCQVSSCWRKWKVGRWRNAGAEVERRAAVSRCDAKSVHTYTLQYLPNFLSVCSNMVVFNIFY